MLNLRDHEVLELLRIAQDLCTTLTAVNLSGNSIIILYILFVVSMQIIKI